MKVISVGGGPAGLYSAILLKRLDPRHEVTVLERNRPDDTFGWGVVFSDDTMAHFAAADAESHRELAQRLVCWTDIDILARGVRLRSPGHGFCGIARKTMLEVLQRRAESLGVRILYETDVAGIEALGAADLVLAADGANSRIRDQFANRFQPSIEWGRCRFCWLGTTLPLEAFTFIFKENEHGLFQVHAYPFSEKLSTFIVECREEVWARAGLDQADEGHSINYLQELFRTELQGHRLIANRSIWRSFPTVRNQVWAQGNLVLIGDAAHTAHFSIGSGTKLAMEDAVALVDTFRRLGTTDVPAVLGTYAAERTAAVARFQSAARTSQEWFENAARHLGRERIQFAFSLLTRSKRVTYGTLRELDPELVGSVTSWFAGANPYREIELPPPAEEAEAALPPAAALRQLTPLFQPYRLRSMTLANRVVVSPMCQYTSKDGEPADWHLVHLGSRAVGGAGLVIAESTHVSADGRITPRCAGMYKTGHVEGWRRIVDFVHGFSRARIGVQLAHAGRKGSCHVPWEGGLPLSEGGWELLAPSPIAYDDGWPVPRAMTRVDMGRVRDDFRRAAAMAEEAAFDMIELHMAHGYLLGTFISPLTNQREDAYGGSIERRMRFPLEVFDAVRAAWPAAKPISVRISATDWKAGGLDSAGRVAIGRMLKEHGCDVVAVSGGQTVSDQEPVYGRMFLVDFSDELRHEAMIPTMTVGNITDADQCQTILAAGRADLCVLARAHLADPYFTLHAAVANGQDDEYWPVQYLPARPTRRRD